MLNDLITVGGSVLTLLLMMIVGFVLAKLGMMSKLTQSQLSTLLLYIVSPAIMIDTLLKQEHSMATVRALLISLSVLVATYVINALLVLLPFRRTAPEQRGIYRFASIYGNTGFMGIPLIQAVLGQSGMIVTVTCLVVFNIAIWTHGAVLIGGKQQASVKKALLNPGVIGFALALTLFALNLPIPAPVTNAIGYIGSLNSPLAMVIIGAQMASVDLKELVKSAKLFFSAFLKLIVAPLITLLVLLPFRLDPVVVIAATILAGCPTAGATSLMSQLMDKDTGLAARLVTLSTILCIITLPVITALARMLTGA